MDLASIVEDTEPTPFVLQTDEQTDSRTDKVNETSILPPLFKGQGHAVSPVCNWLTSFFNHINQTNNSWDTAISKFDLENFKVKLMGDVKIKAT